MQVWREPLIDRKLCFKEKTAANSLARSFIIFAKIYDIILTKFIYEYLKVFIFKFICLFIY